MISLGYYLAPFRLYNVFLIAFTAFIYGSRRPLIILKNDERYIAEEADIEFSTQQ